MSKGLLLNWYAVIQNLIVIKKQKKEQKDKKKLHVKKCKIFYK